MCTRKLLILVAVAVSALVLSSCGDGSGNGGSESPAPTEGPTATPVGESSTFTSDDGKLTMEIPPGALSEEIGVTITAVPLEELPEGLQVLRGAGAGYRLEPDGLEFSQPVTVSLELDRGELEEQPEDGITAVGLASLSQDGERELLQELVTAASLSTDTVTVSGELSHTSWLGRTRSSLTVTLEKAQREQATGATFTARAVAKNTDGSGAVTLGPTLGTFLTSGPVSVSDNPYFYRQATFGPAEQIEKVGSFECGDSPGSGAYRVRVFTTSRVAVESGEPLATQLAVILDGDIECV